MGKGFAEFLENENPDVICLQETKMQREQADFDFPGYHEYWNSAEKKGYSGTAIFSKTEPLSVSYGIGVEEADAEGRVICAEFEQFYLVTVYTPNAQRELVRIDFRMAFEDAFRAYLLKLHEKKPVVVCGDMNVAHKPIDLKNPKSNIGSAGFSYEERGKFTELLASGFHDTFRMLYPDKEGAYSWWSYMFKSRERNTGWRIDYFLVTDELTEKVQDSLILSDVMGSDHCPVGIILE
jgi:exodeoxyribonuclease-3